MDNMPDDELAEALKSMDSIVYGQSRSKNMDVYLEVLRTGATRLYRRKRKFVLDSPVANPIGIWKTGFRWNGLGIVCCGP